MNDDTPLCGCKPILCARCLRVVDGKLIELLRSLSEEEWNRPTIVPRWKVRDVAAHLLDTGLRKLSMVRDAAFVEPVRPQSAEELSALIQRLNAEGVAVYRRLSPPVLIELMTMVCDQSANFHETLDPFAPAVFAVSWAGEATSLNWFDTAREFTERWHHQQQIRLAVDRPGITTPELYHPVLDCFARGLPYALRNSTAKAGESIVLEIAGECGGTWVVTRRATAWNFAGEMPAKIVCKVALPQEIAWRVFTKGIDRDTVRRQVRIEGDLDLAANILEMTAIAG